MTEGAPSAEGGRGQEPLGMLRARWRRVQNPKAVIELFSPEPPEALPCEAPLLSISILNAKSVSVGGLRKGLGRFLSIGSILIDEPPPCPTVLEFQHCKTR